MQDKVCPVCGDELATSSWGSGVVWQCGSHGVKEWWFEDAGAAGFDDRAPAFAEARAEWRQVSPLRDRR